MSDTKQTRNVTLVGGSGTVGTPILAALVATGHKVSVLSRPESTATFPSTVTVHKGTYDDEAFITSILQGQEVLILALNYGAITAQGPLIRAAAAAGVAYVVPCEFGSDATHEPLVARLDLFSSRAQFRRLVEDLGVSRWIGVVNNPWFEFCMRVGAFGLDLKGRMARVFGDGARKANFTTLRRVGESLAALLALPDAELAAYGNSWVYFSSFLVSQRDLLESAKRVTGTRDEDWTVTSEDAEEVIKAAQEEIAKGNRMAGIRILFALLFSEGMGGDYSAKVIDYKKLGLEPEDLDEVMKGLAQEMGA
ncbi:hypothetical protein DL765_004152 [Monosporascus sp. GIB2]|nr:hypothetical protein DL765_004152 [Monosporascus sp. GIB2]